MAKTVTVNRTADMQAVAEAKLKERKDLGLLGKLWSLELYFDRYDSAETQHYLQVNLTGDEIQRYRESIFTIGFQIPVSPGHWRIVMPYELKRVELFRQSKYFE